MIFLARGIALLWAAFWLFFITAESIATDTPPLAMSLWMSVGVIFLLLALLPWRHPRTGGILLLAAALISAVAYTLLPPPNLPLRVRIGTTALFAVPPLAAGLLFLIAPRHATPRPQPHL